MMEASMMNKPNGILPPIVRTDLDFVRELLLSPFGFKGGSVDELWQVISRIEDSQGCTGVGLGVQSILWSDPAVFSAFTQSGGNAAMLMVTQRALSLIEHEPFTTPPRMIEAILPAVYAYACQVTQTDRLQKTFALNALVSVDFALWQLYAAQNGLTSFADMTGGFTSAFTAQHNRIGVIPLVTYGMPIEQVHALAGQGVFFFKIKLGQDPGSRHDPQEMLEADKQRIHDLHQALKDYETPYTDSGHILYYFDANGRYDTKERLLDLLDYMAAIGVLPRTVLLEEPFPEGLDITVGDLPVRIAGDESAHSPEDVKHLIDDLGYGAIALKPIAKTLSLSLKMLDVAQARQVPCFCADLTVNPYLCDWNRNFACRIAPLPGLKIGVMESNGKQNYVHWEQMKENHPIPHAPWLEPDQGIYHLDDLFYQTSGGILMPPRL
jgi:L-alanine-DL-glutamate epimerase-like enolase superfamily enzyme